MSKIKVSEFIKDLADKAGIAEDDASLIDVLSHTELNKIEIPAVVTSKIQQNLLSVTDAKNNHPKVKTHYFGEFMSNVDRGLETLYQELGLDDDDINELNAEKSSTKRIGLLGKVLKTKLEDKPPADTKTPEKIAGLTRQIEELNDKLRLEKEAHNNAKKEHKRAMDEFKTDSKLTALSAALQTVYDTLPGDVRDTTIKTLLRKELQDSDSDFILEENGSIKLQKKDGSSVFDEENRLVTVESFINKTLAKHKILKQSAPTPPAQPGGGEPPNNGQPPKVEGGQPGKKMNLSGLFDESLKPLEAQQPQQMI